MVGAVGAVLLFGAVVASGWSSSPTSLQAEGAGRTRSGAAPGTREKLASWGEKALDVVGSWEGLSPVAANPQPVLHAWGGRAHAQKRAGAARVGSAARKGAAAVGAQLALAGPTPEEVEEGTLDPLSQYSKHPIAGVPMDRWPWEKTAEHASTTELHPPAPNEPRTGLGPAPDGDAVQPLERAGVNVRAAFNAGSEAGSVNDGGDHVVPYSPGHPVGALANDLLGPSAPEEAATFPGGEVVVSKWPWDEAGHAGGETHGLPGVSRNGWPWAAVRTLNPKP